MSVVLEKTRTAYPELVVVKPKVNLNKGETNAEHARRLIAEIQQKDAEKVEELISVWEQKTEEDFEKFQKNRIFFPETSPEYHAEFLHWLCTYLHTMTGKYYVFAFFEQEDIRGVFIQQADNLLDKDRNYVQSDDTVYDENGIAYHVSYYENNGLHIILDRPDADDFRVVENLSAYSCTKPKKKERVQTTVKTHSTHAEPVQEEPAAAVPDEEDDDKKISFFTDSFSYSSTANSAFISAIGSTVAGGFMAVGGRYLCGQMTERMEEQLATAETMTEQDVQLIQMGLAASKMLSTACAVMGMSLIMVGVMKSVKRLTLGY